MRHNAPFSKIEPAGRLGQWRRGFLLAAVAVLALAASLVMTPAPAEAQSTVTMVSNLSLGAQQTSIAGGSHPKFAGAFTTGPAGGGYGLASVTLRLGASTTISTTLDVAIHSDSSGVPGQRLFALDNPSETNFGSATTLAIGVPPGTRLTPNTTYWVVAGTTSGNFRIFSTLSDDEHSGKQPGWSIGDSLVSMSGPDASWVTNTARSMQMAVEGVVFDTTLVSNLGQGSSGSTFIGGTTFDWEGSTSFTTGPDKYGYVLSSAALSLRLQTSGTSSVPELIIHSDSNGLPGSKLFTLDNPSDIDSVSTGFRVFRFYAPPGTRLEPNTTYWLNVTAAGSSLLLPTTSGHNEDASSSPGWSIGDDTRSRKGTRTSSPWELNFSGIKFGLQGVVFSPTRTESAVFDLPFSNDTWGFVDTSAPSTGTMYDTVDDGRRKGDWWELRMPPHRRYRVEVNFGTSATPNANRGGTIDIHDGSWRGDLWDHNRDDGRAFIDFYAYRRGSGGHLKTYFLVVKPSDSLNTGSLDYFGPYTITLTDITHITRHASNWADYSDFYTEVGDHTAGIVVDNRWIANSFTTGAKTGGYELSYVVASLRRESGNSSVKAALYTNATGNTPGTKIFDFDRISRLTGAPSPYAQRFWAPANTTLTASTTYWVVFKDENFPGSSYGVARTTSGTINPYYTASGWSIGANSAYYGASADTPSWVVTSHAGLVMDIYASRATASMASEAVDQAAPQLQSASVDGHTLTLAYDEELDLTSSPPSSAFTVNVNGEERPLVSVGVGQSSVLLSLSTPVEAGDTVTVDYTVPTGESEGKLQDPAGNAASSFTAQQVTNDTASSGGSSGGGESGEAYPPAAVPLTATAHGVPADHDGSTTFSFELRFSETPEDDFSYKTLRDHAFSVTGGEVVKANRLVPGENVRWQVHVAPDGSGAATIVLPPTTDCDADGAICTEDGAMLSGRLEVTVPQQNTAATGAPTISGTAQVGETLTAGTTAISDADGLDDDTFDYQWIANDGAADADITGATGSSYTLVDDDEGKAIMVRVSFTDEAGNDESLTSAAAAPVTAAPSSISEDEEEETTPLTAGAHDVPGSHDGSTTFTFELRFSEQIPLSYATLRDHAFTVTGGEVTKARRLEPGNSAGKNVRWEISVTPDGNGAVTIVLPPTTDCEAEGAICTEDGGMLSNRLEITVPGPGG